MSLENGERLAEKSEVAQRLKAIADLKNLNKEGLHVNSLSQIIEQEEIHTHEPTFAERNRILTRRQSRRTTALLIRRHL